MKSRRLLPERYEIGCAPPRRNARPARWRSFDLKGPLPARTVKNLLAAIESLPGYRPWPDLDEEAWWADVLADRRLNAPGAKNLTHRSLASGFRLDRCPAKSLTFTCGDCGASATYTVAKLCQMFGPDRNIRTIGDAVVKCGNRRLRRDGPCPIKYRA